MENTCFAAAENTGEQTVHQYRRRISSILKAPRSPLKDVGEKQMCQEHIRKGRKSVSFADNKEVKYYKPDEIEVMEKESNQGNELDQQQEGFDQKNLMEKNSWDISNFTLYKHVTMKATHTEESIVSNNYKSNKEHTQRFNQFFINEESEQSLYEKLQAGTIRVQEFFKLLGVRLLIQRPRHSTLLACEDCNAAPSPEEQWLDRCIQRPKLQVYQEDCQALSQTIEELKLNMYDEDKFLVDVNKSLWEAIKSSSLSELKHWGGVLNTQKSYFTKKSKLLFHQRKVKLYSKLFESAQTQQEQLQKKMAADDQLLSEIDCCLASLEMETLNLDTCAVDDDLVAEQELELQVKERELEELSTRNKDFQSELVDLEKQKVECIGRKKELQTKTANCEEYLEEYRRLSDWKLQEWQESQAYFTFLYNSLELTVTFGETLDGVEFVDKPCKKIESVNFDSQLDDDIAPSYTLLVHRLVFQFIKQKGIWQETYPTQRHLPALLHDLSLVVSGCRLLGEEIHYLSRWGGKFNILKTDVHGNNVSFLFASVIAHSKFEITISLTPGYPDAPLQFMFRNHIGNLSQSHLSKVISDVQPGSSYLKRVVKSVHQKLLSMPP
nr:PREDICTED: protein CASC5 [Latimeria chalumnae]|eukprot:XP_014340921.1 PREDICTED: protein CASC5 [Latimeria chalumnae]